jgi:Flp pilus assembly protein TadD
VLFFTNARFRLPLALALLVLAGLGIAAIVEHIRRGTVDLRRAASASLAATLAVVLAYGDWHDIRDYRIPQLDVNAGAMEREARNFDSAILFLRSGIGREPRDPIGWVHLALALEQAGHVDAAREAYESGLGYVPGDPQITEMQARFRERNPR